MAPDVDPHDMSSCRIVVRALALKEANAHE